VSAREAPACDGTLIWYFAGEEPNGAVLHCSRCGEINVTGNFTDPAHAGSPVMREGLA
jgi:hypothetical protein